MSEAETKETEGLITEVLPNALFRVELAGGEKRQVTAHVSGKTRLNLVKLLPGDRVYVELSAFDGSRGRIVRRCTR